MMGGPENPNPELPEFGEAEKLNYITDMIYELKEMAAQVGSGTLVAILAAALIEARIQKGEAER